MRAVGPHIYILGGDMLLTWERRFLTSGVTLWLVCLVWYTIIQPRDSLGLWGMVANIVLVRRIRRSIGLWK